VKNPELFEYLAAFVTIVLAIALSDMLMSLHRLLAARARVTWSVIPLAATLFVFLSLLSEFFSIHSVANVATVSYGYLVLLVFVSGTNAMEAFVVLPDDVPEAGLSLWDSYLERRAQIWILMALAWAGDLARTVVYVALSNRLPGFFSPVVLHVVGIALTEIAIFVILAWRKERWVHALGLALIFASIMPNFVGWDIH
jgi:predicted tellurium resistance membrane protein TerC